MALFSKLLSYDNPVLAGFMTYGSVLVLKMMMMSLLTGRQRHMHGVATSSEDIPLLKGKPLLKSHEDVDRVRRAHLNDIENIPIFFMASFAYIFTDPDPTIAINLFRIYTLARCMHTFVYAVVVIPQPARAITWFTGYFITGYMAVRSICHFNNL